MNWTEIGIAFIAGGGIQALLNHFIAGKTQKRDDFEKIVETWETDNARLRKENSDLHTELEDLRNQLSSLKLRVMELERTTIH